MKKFLLVLAVIAAASIIPTTSVYAWGGRVIVRQSFFRPRVQVQVFAQPQAFIAPQAIFVQPQAFVAQPFVTQRVVVRQRFVVPQAVVVPQCNVQSNCASALFFGH